MHIVLGSSNTDLNAFSEHLQPICVSPAILREPALPIVAPHIPEPIGGLLAWWR